MLLCAYFLRLQRLNEMALQRVCQEDLITAWSNPSPAMQSAARLVQGKFRRGKKKLWLVCTQTEYANGLGNAPSRQGMKSACVVR